MARPNITGAAAAAANLMEQPHCLLRRPSRLMMRARRTHRFFLLQHKSSSPSRLCCDHTAISVCDKQHLLDTKQLTQPQHQAGLSFRGVRIGCDLLLLLLLLVVVFLCDACVCWQERLC
jgi:hypothetical protein